MRPDLTYTYSGDCRIVVTDTGSGRSRPVIDVDVFYFRTPTAERGRQEHVVQLLAVVVEDIRVPFRWRDVRHLVDVGE